MSANVGGFTVAFTIPGAPRTKKNHGRVIKRGTRRFHIPSAPYEQWVSAAQFEIAAVKRRAPVGMFPIPKTVPLNCRATFFRDADRGDAVGYYQGLADLLQVAGIVEDDVSIAAWDGSRLHKDAARPRVELVLELLIGTDAPAETSVRALKTSPTPSNRSSKSSPSETAP